MDSKLSLELYELAKDTSSTIKGLPLELNQMIWKSTLTDNRIITINWAHTSHRDLGKRCLAKDFHASYEKIKALTPSNNVWSNDNIRAANVKRIAIDMENDPNMALDTSTSLELNFLRWATLRFCTLEKIFIQPVFAFDSFCETVFRTRFQELMRDYQELFGPLRQGQEYRIPEIFLVCLQCDPDLSKAVQR
ncbi:hypothetical protein sscle_09g070810 [Sclerotinia sclerotiorum 1980 UF-70]|uniref:Uncharacterized protein n=1 Tax=Sclerotinia sclerotiorum (strain ATCC 18683 / 1980 / Ss-1) TaxID=665079 RepID=A0A1D9QBM4_SCLS1|nr:hypothetical protein sscle_09g070810 [Sclerotinia sclerotiorum 1980 UF-70]